MTQKNQQQNANGNENVNILQEIQNILFKALNQNQELNKQLKGENRIFDYIPPGAPFPRLVFDKFTVNPWDSQTSKGYQILATIRIWSKNTGRKNLSNIIFQTENVLRNIPKNHDNIHIISLRIIEKETNREHRTQNFMGTINLQIHAQNRN